MNFFSYILKKNVLVFAFLFAIICAVVLPVTANAADWSCAKYKATRGGAPVSVCLDEISPDTAQTASFGWSEVGKSVVVSLARLILWGAYRIAVYAAFLVGYVISTIMYSPITTDARFTTAWISVRDLANMFIVLGFVIVGIATALRIREYEAKKLLWPLIIIALLINFSGLFCGLIIDASNLVTSSLGSSTGTIGESVVIQTVRKSSVPILNADKAATDTMNFIANCIFFSIIYIAEAITFLYMSVILIVRYAILIMLYVLSPIAFAFWVFPVTKKYWTEWWSNFLKWCFVGVSASFFLMIAVKLMPSGAAGVVDATFTETLTSFVLVLVALFVGFKITAKSSGLASVAAGAVMGLATGGAGFAMGALSSGGKLGLKGLGRASGVTELATKAGHGATRMAEKAGLVKAGTSASWEKARLEKDKKQYDSMTSRDLAADVNRGALTSSGRKANDIKAQILAERGDLDKIGRRGKVGIDEKGDETIRNAVVNRAVANDRTGEVLKSFKKSDPRYAGLDKDAVAKEMRDAQIAGAPIKEEDARNKVIASAFQKVNVGDIRSFGPGVLKSPEFAQNVKLKRAIKAGSEMSTKQVNAMLDGVQAEMKRLKPGAPPPLPIHAAKYAELAKWEASLKLL